MRPWEPSGGPDSHGAFSYALLPMSSHVLPFGASHALFTPSNVHETRIYARLVEEGCLGLLGSPVVYRASNPDHP